MGLMNNSLAPDLSVRLLRENEEYAIYAGLWSTWWVNETNASAKVLLITVLKEPGIPAPPGPLALAALVPWVVFQMHAIDEESPMWSDVQRVLGDDFKRMSEQQEPSKQNSTRMVFDTSQKNHNIRAIAEPSQLTAFKLEQDDGSSRSHETPHAHKIRGHAND